MTLQKGYQALLDEARGKIDEWETVSAHAKLNDDNVVFVDIRDIRELQRDGKIAGAIHAPRGMLEFWVDPASPYHRSIFASGKQFLLYCQSGWRSSLAAATLTDMGVPNVAHLKHGFKDWQQQGFEIESLANKDARS